MSRQDAPAWRLVPRLLLRRAGFGFGLLDALCDPDVGRCAAVYRETVRDLQVVRERLLRGTIPAAVRAARAREDRASLRWLSATRSAIGRGRELPGRGTPPPGACAAELTAQVEAYHAALWRSRAAGQRLDGAVAADAPAQYRRLCDRLDARVLDALVQLSPSYYDSVRRWMSHVDGTGGARDRAMHRRLYLYLQRLAAKNETTSFFGPVEHGVLDPHSSGLNLAGGTGGVRETRPFLAFWAACEIARALAADPAVGPAVPVGWIAANHLETDVLTTAGGRRVLLPAEVAKLASAIDGQRSAADLARSTGRPLPDVVADLQKLQRLGAVRTWPEPASTSATPFDQVRADAARFAAGTPWPQRLAGLWQRVEAYAAADDPRHRRAALAGVEAAFTGLTGRAARRDGGRMYADRMVVYLDSRGDLAPVRMGGDLAALIEDELAPVLDVGARHGELWHRAYQRLGAEVLARAGVASMRYDEFALRTGRAVAEGRLRAYLGPVDELCAALANLVRARLDRRGCALEPAELAGVLQHGGSDDPPAGPGAHRDGPPGPDGAAGGWPRPPGPDGTAAGWPRLTVPDGAAAGWPRFASPDVLLEQGPDGRPDRLRLVLGEVHPYVFAWGSQGLFCPDPQGLREAFAADLGPWGGASSMATLVRRRRHKGLVSEDFPGRFVEVTAVASRRRERTVAVTELVVDADGDRLRLRDGRGEDVVLYAGEEDHPHLMAFAPPPTTGFPLVRLGDAAPRITVSRTVVQRASWWLPAGDLTGQASGHAGGSQATSGFRTVQERRAVLRLPRWVYAHVGGEPKPVCVDLDCPLAVDALLGLVRQGTAGTVRLTEMLPEPHRLWLRPGGTPVTSELRLAAVRSAP